MDYFLNDDEQQVLLQERLNILQKYRTGIEKQINPLWENEVSSAHSANVKRMIDLVDAEITGTNRLLESCNANILHKSMKWITDREESL